MRRHFRAVATFAVLASLAVGLSACGEKRATPSPKKLLKKLLKDEIVTIDDQSGSGFGRLPIDIWAPFRWEAKFGIFDVSRAAGLAGAIFGTELDERGTDPWRFFGFYGQYVGGGIQVFVSSGTVPGSGATNHGDRFYASTLVVEVAIVADGATLTFLARPAGSAAAYDEIASIPFVNQPVPLNPGIGVFGFSGPAEVGFGSIRLPENADAPEPVSEQQAAANAIIDTLLSVASGRYELTGEAPDAAAALEDFRDAQGLLDDAILAVSALGVTGKKPKVPEEEALKRLNKTAKRLGKLVTKLEKRGDKAAKSGFKKTRKILYLLVDATDWILPDDLRATINGTPNSLRDR